MPRATKQQIDKSTIDHSVDVRQHAPKRHADRTDGSYTSDGSKAVRNRTAGAFTKPTADYRGPEPQPDGNQDAARYWRTVRKQVMAGARVTARR